MARGVSISGLNLFPVRVVPIGPVLFRRDASERGRGFARASQCHAKTYPHMNHIVISHNGFQYCVQDVEPDADVLFQCLKKKGRTLTRNLKQLLHMCLLLAARLGAKVVVCEERLWCLVSINVPTKVSCRSQW